MNQQRRTYTKEFKDEAVCLYKASGKTMAAIEQELGLSKGLLKQWVRAAEQAGTETFPGHDRRKASNEQLRALERELAIVREERYILKKKPSPSVHKRAGEVRVHRASPGRVLHRAHVRTAGGLGERLL